MGGGTAGRGAILAGLTYWLTGVAWVLLLNAETLLSHEAGDLLEAFFAAPVFALIWPLQVAQALGLFGLSFGQRRIRQ